MAVCNGGNTLWCLRVEMGFKLPTRQWFVMSLIRFGEDPLHLCMEKGWCFQKMPGKLTIAERKLN